MEQLDAGWSPLPTERRAGGDRDDADPELEAAEAAEADREAIEAMVAADREVRTVPSVLLVHMLRRFHFGSSTKYTLENDLQNFSFYTANATN